MAGGKFVGMEFGLDLCDKIKTVRIPKSKYDHFAVRPDLGMVGCFDAFNGVVWAAPIDKVAYIKNLEEGDWKC